jgi:rhamnose utilization protein RhaD (predicted bifunctional aldolase and dehydrogenase)/NAD(P)-dependent dehydrogenase (short-subunit alcohol dehydrogenase family)
MRSRWSDADARRFVDTYAPRWGEALALRTYTSRLLGAEPALVLHGGGNTSVKDAVVTVLGEQVPALFVKASGRDLAAIEPEDHPAVDLTYVRRLRALEDLSDEALINELRTHLFDHRAPTPSLETPVHAFLPHPYIDHTHADAILALTNQEDGEAHVRAALGDAVVVLAYVSPGLRLARAAADAFEAHPTSRGMVWMHHGLVTWGATAREAYEATIELVSRAEAYLARRAARRIQVAVPTALATAAERFVQVAPIVRGLLARRGTDDPTVRHPLIVRGLVDEATLAVVDGPEGASLALAPPLTADHLIRTRARPLWVTAPRYDDLGKLRADLAAAMRAYADEYRQMIERHAGPASAAQHDLLPRVVLLPGLGALCAGPDARAATVAAEITAHTLAVKAQVAAMGRYRGLPESELVKMEFRAFQQAKIRPGDAPRLAGHVALVTGAAGAIGAGIVEGLLQHGAHVAVTDLPGERLDSLVKELDGAFGPRVLGVPLDVTDPASVTEAFRAVIRTWGGVDLVVVNAGLAHAAPLAELALDAFRRLERVNVEGTLIVLAEAARHFAHQRSGGDIVVISTKNVFAPGAQFGAYSATKAAAHQLGRIASLELAALDVRVNMVSPDAVFAHRARRSGLWAAVGPERMRARGLDEAGLEEYYRSRNLLKARVTATDVANAVLFFATRQTPTTGATLPVDGGLPDATPR